MIWTYKYFYYYYINKYSINVRQNKLHILSLFKGIKNMERKDDWDSCDYKITKIAFLFTKSMWYFERNVQCDKKLDNIFLGYQGSHPL